ncbi:MAG: hypothetical protein BYD32DRAFT_431484 [Podila humilis]|nr:MAG: hypothetical protein BYD32DRAFT_431484 [Podila humilis]
MKFITFSAIVVAAVIALASSAEAATPCYTSCMKQNANDHNYCAGQCYDKQCARDCQKMGEAWGDCVNWCRN